MKPASEQLLMATDMAMERYRVRVSKDYLSFCAAHFIVYKENQCERLHGHNYRVAAELEGTLDGDHLVFDFIELKKILKSICDELDHRMLVPTNSTTLAIEVNDSAVSMSFEARKWLFPRTDCVLLPFENTTAEQLAAWFAHRLAAELRRLASNGSGLARPDGKPTVSRVKIELFEGPGQSAEYSLDF